VNGTEVKERERVTVFWKYLEQEAEDVEEIGTCNLDAICKAAIMLPEPEKIDAFWPFSHRDLMLLRC
jgi:hypothetical protein